MRLVDQFLVDGLSLYRAYISPAMPQRCRFEPSCSAYALTAVHRHGALRGVWLALVRVVRCGPWSAGGSDPVPGAKGEV